MSCSAAAREAFVYCLLGFHRERKRSMPRFNTQRHFAFHLNESFEHPRVFENVQQLCSQQTNQLNEQMMTTHLEKTIVTSSGLRAKPDGP
jgi:hypothetical protein